MLVAWRRKVVKRRQCANSVFTIHKWRLVEAATTVLDSGRDNMLPKEARFPMYQQSIFPTWGKLGRKNSESAMNACSIASERSFQTTGSIATTLATMKRVKTKPKSKQTYSKC